MTYEPTDDDPVQAFLLPEPELVALTRAGIEAHKQKQQERDAYWIAHCLRLLREGEGERVG